MNRPVLTTLIFICFVLPSVANANSIADALLEIQRSELGDERLTEILSPRDEKIKMKSFLVSDISGIQLRNPTRERELDGASYSIHEFQLRSFATQPLYFTFYYVDPVSGKEKTPIIKFREEEILVRSYQKKTGNYGLIVSALKESFAIELEIEISASGEVFVDRFFIKPMGEFSHLEARELFTASLFPTKIQLYRENRSLLFYEGGWTYARARAIQIEGDSLKAKLADEFGGSALQITCSTSLRPKGKMNLLLSGMKRN